MEDVEARSCLPEVEGTNARTLVRYALNNFNNKEEVEDVGNEPGIVRDRVAVDTILA